MAGDEIQQIKDRINIAEVVGQYVTLRRAGRTFVGKCPFHKERTPSFHVSPERGTYKCFGCGEGGDVFSFVQKMDGIDFPTALKLLAERAGVKLERRFVRPKEEVEKGERLIQICEMAAQFFVDELQKRKEVQKYIQARGVKEETMQEWKLGYAPASWDALSTHLRDTFTVDELVDAGISVRSEKRPGEIFDRFRGRIMFPISDAGGSVVGFSGRFFEKVPGQKGDIEPAKYINSPETQVFKKSRILYGYHKALKSIRKADCILLVEGQFDLILAHQSGLSYTVALSGTALTMEHLIRLGRLSKRLVLSFDADEAGLKAGLKSALMAIEAGFDVKVPSLPPGSDPADLAKKNPELLKAAVRVSKTAVEFFLEALRARARDARAYAKLVERDVLPLVAATQSHIEQAHLIALVASRLGVPESAVYQEVRRRGTSGAAAPSEDATLGLHPAEGADLTALEKKTGMLLFGHPESEQKLVELLSAERVGQLRHKLTPQAEELRFVFDAEVHEETTAERVARDMLAQIADTVGRVKMKSV